MDLFNPLVEHAIELAAQWHDQTYRKSRWRRPPFDPPEEVLLRIPAMAHVTAVAFTVQRAGWEDEVVAAAFLHDVLEDQNRYGQTFRKEQMDALVGTEVTRLVEVVTEQKVDAEGTFRPWKDRKVDYVAQIKAGPPEAAAISLADKLHNAWSMNEALASGVDIFTSAQGRKGMSAGPEAQCWFYESVLAATEGHTDERLHPMRIRLSVEIERFCTFSDLRSPGPAFRS